MEQRSVSRTVSSIINANTHLAEFWSNSHGWVTSKVAEFISRSRLDRQVLLSKALQIWIGQDLDEGQLILAWANLGALVEGTIKLFLSVHYTDYLNDSERFLKRNKSTIEPDVLTLESLKQFIKKKGLLSLASLEFIDLVQKRRNAIHAFKDRPLGSKEEFFISLSQYLELLREINDHLIYPDDYHYQI